MVGCADILEAGASWACVPRRDPETSLRGALDFGLPSRVWAFGLDDGVGIGFREGLVELIGAFFVDLSVVNV